MPLVFKQSELEFHVPPPHTSAEFTEELDSKAGIWIRSCPICRMVLTKSDPHDTIVCRCGWRWQG